MKVNITRFIALQTGALLALALTAFAQSPTKPRASEPNGSLPLANSRQLLVVITKDWTAMKGRLQRYERTNRTSAWQATGKAFTVVLGKNGLAWAGDRQRGTTEDKLKHEGDGKAPAGVFPLGTAFGQSANKKLPEIHIPYLFLSDNVECVDDSTSSHYNHLVSKQGVAPDWKSSEKMWTEPLYKWGVVVQYNTPNPRPGAGSCIFLHIWKGPESGTAGCTAMSEADLVTVMQWLDRARNPVLVQLPVREYNRLRPEWQLP